MNNFHTLLSHLSNLNLASDLSNIEYSKSFAVISSKIIIYISEHTPFWYCEYITEEHKFRPYAINFVRQWCEIVLNCQPRGIMVSMWDAADIHDETDWEFDIIAATTKGVYNCLTVHKRSLNRILTTEAMKDYE